MRIEYQIILFVLIALIMAGVIGFLEWQNRRDWRAIRKQQDDFHNKIASNLPWKR
jgi:cytochrome c biogenesis protein ResB